MAPTTLVAKLTGLLARVRGAHVDKIAVMLPAEELGDGTVLTVRGKPATGRVALDDVHLASDGHERGDSGHRPESHRAPAGIFLAMKVQGRV